MEVYKQKAKKIGVTIKPSNSKDKKFDVYKDSVFQASIGSAKHKDYEVYKKESLELANERRRLYRIRHEKDRKVKYKDSKLTAGYLADKILW
jgi:hypothetical protein